MATGMSTNPNISYTSNSQNTVTLNKDPDSPKLFLGQIPIDVGEGNLRSILEVYGPLANIVIMEPKNGVDIKYGFVTFVHKKDSDNAIAALNEKFTFPNSKRCLQMRPAEGEGSAAGVKLFISHIPLTVVAEHLSGIFSSFGKVEESKILLTSDGKSKGCGFVRMSNLQDSVRALEAINKNCKIEGQQIRAFFAETAKEKKYRKKLKNNSFTPSPYPTCNNSLSVAQPSTYYNPYFYMSYTMNPMYNIPSDKQFFPLEKNTNIGNPELLPSLNQLNASYTDLVHPQIAYTKIPTYKLTPPTPLRRMGPIGANLYIYHIPFDWNSSNLWDIFVQIGPLINAYVATDKVTGKNRGFGFISYKMPESAQKALSILNGKTFSGKKIFLKMQKF